jgi:hypothetical protein
VPLDLVEEAITRILDRSIVHYRYDVVSRKNIAAMSALKKTKTAVSDATRNHRKATYTLPPDALAAADEHWRFHETLDAGLVDSKSEYVADLIRRDAARKNAVGKAASQVQPVKLSELLGRHTCVRGVRPHEANRKNTMLG